MKENTDGNNRKTLVSVIIVAILLLSGMGVLISGNAMYVNGDEVTVNETSPSTALAGPEAVKNLGNDNAKENGVSLEQQVNRRIEKENRNQLLEKHYLNPEATGGHKNMILLQDNELNSLYAQHIKNREDKSSLPSWDSARQSSFTVSKRTRTGEGTRSAEPGPNPSDSGGPDNWGYIWVNSTGNPSVNYNWIEINSTGTDSGVTGDDNYGSATIGFDFSFYENKYDSVYFSTNGLISFGAGSGAYDNAPIHSTGDPSNIICPFWDDLQSNGGSIYYQLIGTEPHRQFIVEWDDWWTLSGYGPMKFEAILNETGEIWFQYESMGNANSSSATVGIENSDGTDGLQYLYNSQGITDGLAIEFIYIPPPYRMLLRPANQHSINNPGDTVWYALSIGNYGANNDTYNLSVSDNTWTTTLYDASGTNQISQISLNSGESANITVKVDIPSGANPGDYDITYITAASQNDTNTSETSTITTQVSAPILVVDDDSGLDTENWYYDALDDNAYEYNFWDVQNWGSPDLNTLEMHNVTIWFTGNDDGWNGYTLTASDRQNLGDYLDNGGRLYFSSSLAGVDAYWNNGWDGWYETYLHAQFIDEYWGGSYTFNGVPYDSIGDSMVLQTGTGDVDWNLWGYHGRNNPINGGIVSFNYSGNSEAGLIRANTGTYRVVYSSFDFAYVNDSSTRDQFMHRIIHWLTTPYGVALTPSSASRFGDPSTTVNYTLTIINSGNVPDTYNLTVSNNTWPTTIYDMTGTNPITQISLNSGESANITVKVGIPSDANLGDHDISAIVASSQNDTSVQDDAQIRTYYLHGPHHVALFQTKDPWDLPAIRDILSEWGIPYTVYGPGDIGAVNLSAYDKVIIVGGDGQDSSLYSAISDNKQWFESYVENGGILNIHADDWGDFNDIPCGLSSTYNEGDTVNISYPDHPFLTLPNNITDTELDNWHNSYHRYFTDWPLWADTVLSEGDSGSSYPVLLDYPWGDGRVIATGQTVEWAWSHGYSKLLENLILAVEGTSTYLPYLVSITPENQHSLGDLGTSVWYNLTIHNIGTNNDTYNLSVSDNAWPTTIYATGTNPISQISLNSNESANITVRVDFPAGANPGDYDIAHIIATSQNDTDANVSSEILTQALAPILVVDDDSGLDTENWYYTALDDNNYSYNFWDVQNWGSPDLNTLEMHDVVIWFTGNDDGYSGTHTLTATDRQNLGDYLDNGGRLYFSSGAAAVDAYWANGWSAWHEEYLHAELVNAYWSYATNYTGLNHDPIGDGMVLHTGVGDYDTNLIGHTMELSPVNGSVVSFNFTENSDAGIIRMDTGIYRVVYSGFDFAYLNDSSVRDQLMYRIIHWLTYPYGVVLTPSSASRFGDSSTTVNYTLRITNSGDVPDSYNLTVSNNTWTTTIYDSTGTNTISQISLNSRESANITVKVDIPSGANLGDYDIAHIIAISQNDTDANVSSEILTQALAPILVVDDDSGLDTENWYYTALDDNNYSYNFWDVQNWGSPDLNTLEMHDVVIWFTGNDYGTSWGSVPTLDVSDRANLGTYLDDGGRLYFSSSLAGVDAGTNGWSNWYRTYLHSSYQNYYGGHTPYVLNGSAGDPISDGLNFTAHQGDSNPNLWGYWTNNTPVNGGITFFTEPTPTYVATRADTGVYRVVYTAFDFADVNGAANRTLLMYRIIEWLTSTVPPSVIEEHPSDGSSDVSASQDVQVIFSKEMDTTVTPDIVQTGGTDPGGWTFLGWSSTHTDNDTATWSHNDWSYSDNVELKVSNYTDMDGLSGSPYSWNFTIASGPTATATGPTNSDPSNVADITITYDNDTGATSVDLYYTTDNGNTWTHIGSDSSIDGQYDWTIPSDGTYGWMAVGDGESAPSSGDAPEASSYTYDGTQPTVSSTNPSDGATEVSVGQDIVVIFDESMDTSVTPTLSQTSGTSVTYTFAGWTTTNVDNDTATWTHNDWDNSDTIELTVSGAEDVAGNTQADHTWSFDTVSASSHTATATGPTNSDPSNVAHITIEYTYEVGVSSVDLYYTTDNGNTWTHIGSDSSIDGQYDWTIPSDGTYGWMAVGDGESAPSSGDAPEASSYTYDGTQPTVSSTNPSDGATGVSITQDVVISFSESIDASTFNFTCEPDPGGWSVSWNSDKTQATLSHASFALATRYWMNITSANDTAGNTLSGAPYSFDFTTESTDTTPPTVVSVSPTGTDISVSSAITITFNESMNTSSVEKAFSINPAITGDFSWDAAKRTMTFTSSSDLEGGTTYTVKVDGSIANDTNGNSLDGNKNGTSEGSPKDDYSWSFTTETLDSQAPTSSTSPVTPYWHTSKVTLELTASDDKELSNITIYYRFSEDNSTWSAWIKYVTISISGTSWTGSRDFIFSDGDGYYQFYTKASDASGKSEEKNSAEAIAGYDTIVPDLSIDSPEDGGLFNTDSMTVRWHASDNTSKIDHYEVRMDRGSWIGVGKNTSYDFTGISDGRHTVEVKAVDRAGNEKTASAGFETDTTPPSVTSASPTGNNVSVDTTITVRFSEDMNVSTVKVIGDGLSGNISWSGRTLTFTPSSELEHGRKYVVHVTGSDLAGNRLDYTWNFTTAHNAPEDMATITGTVTDENGNPIEGATVRLDTGETAITDASGHFEIEVHAGNHTLAVSKDGYEKKTIETSVSPGEHKNIPAVELPASKKSSSGMPWLYILLILVIVGIIAAVLIAKRKRPPETNPVMPMQSQPPVQEAPPQSSGENPPQREQEDESGVSSF